MIGRQRGQSRRTRRHALPAGRRRGPLDPRGGQPDRYRRRDVRRLDAERQRRDRQARAQTQALQSQKLEAIGAFAAGITHDFNNLLTSIRGYTELVQLELERAKSPRAARCAPTSTRSSTRPIGPSAITGQAAGVHPRPSAPAGRHRSRAGHPRHAADAPTATGRGHRGRVRRRREQSWIRIDPVALDQVSSIWP